MGRRTNPARTHVIETREVAPRRGHNDHLAYVTDRLLDLFEQTLGIGGPKGHIPGLYESLQGDLMAQGVDAIDELLRRHLGAGGNTTPEVLSVVQLAGQYGARVFVAPPGAALSIQFPHPPNSRVLAMISASGMQNVQQWMWSEDVQSAGRLLGPGR